MARSITKKSSTATTKKTGVTSVVKEDAPVIKFSNNDGILCKSILPGVTNVKGKNGEIFSFRILGDELEIPYEDLKWMVQSRSKFLFHPYIVVKNEDFVSQFPTLSNFYNENYADSDIYEILRRPTREILLALDSMPAGTKDSVKSIAATMIGSGELDSVTTIKALDNYFGTKLMLITGLYND